MSLQQFLESFRSCTHTDGGKNNWWMGTLAENTAVTEIVIYNREDCCSDRIHGAKVDLQPFLIIHLLPISMNKRYARSILQ